MSKTKNYIGKIADLFSVPIATLRYWGKEGLVEFDQSEENGYRTWSMHTLRTLCDITLYRQLSVPVHDLKNLHSLSHKEIAALLQIRREHICNTISELQDKLNHVDIKLSQVETVERMSDTEPQFVSLSLPSIEHYELLQKDNLSHLFDHEKDIVILINPEAPSLYHYGIYAWDEPHRSSILREQDPAPRLYLHVLLKSTYEDPANNDLSYYYDYLRERGYRPGITVGKVLVSAYDRELYNYYDAYIEALAGE